eukprot:COSAG06_NODE_1553_length_9121_cov_5.225781_5_plen_81_part_00
MRFRETHIERYPRHRFRWGGHVRVCREHNGGHRGPPLQPVGHHEEKPEHDFSDFTADPSKIFSGALPLPLILQSGAEPCW